MNTQTLARKHITIAEDDREIARLTGMLLESEGYQTSFVHRGDQVVEHVRQKQPDAVILDLMLPGKNGVDVCRELRDFYQKPILVLTGCDDDFMEVSAFNRGANDYVLKPAKPHILLVRLNALLRQWTDNHEVASTEKHSNTRMQIGDLVIDAGKREVMLKGEPVLLTDAEFDLLALLADANGDVVNRHDCCISLRGIGYDGLDRSVDMRVSGLRKKLQDDVAPHRLIKTVRGKGYMLIQGN